MEAIPLQRHWLSAVSGTVGALMLTLFTPVTTMAHLKHEEKTSSTLKTAYIDVSVATLWTSPGLTRPIDQPSLSNPVDIRAWIDSMDTQQKLWLVGNLQTQALYGTKVTVLNTEGGWVEVAVHGQPTPKNPIGYPAWMPKAQLTFNRQYQHLQAHHPFALVTKPTAWLYDDRRLHHKDMELSFDTRLPVLARHGHEVLVATTAEGNKWMRADDVAVYRSNRDIPKPTGQDLVERAKLFLGLPYLWAGTSGFGFDCSGFTHTIYDSFGITIPRDADAQAQAGIPVAKDELQPGDLVFFAYDHGKGYIHHVAMYIGDGKIIQSPNTGSSVDIVNLDDFAYSDQYAGARRYI
jgi:cell wall-associated NlpC family hydrolase